jgi:hypothetical protein
MLSFISRTVVAILALAATVPAAGTGTVRFTNKNRFLFDVDGNQIDAYAAKIYCESLISVPS